MPTATSITNGSKEDAWVGVSVGHGVGTFTVLAFKGVFTVVGANVGTVVV